MQLDAAQYNLLNKVTSGTTGGHHFYRANVDRDVANASDHEAAPELLRALEVIGAHEATIAGHKTPLERLCGPPVKRLRKRLVSARAGRVSCHIRIDLVHVASD